MVGPQVSLWHVMNNKKEKYTLSSNKGEKFDALAMTEPGAGSDVRGMECTAQKKKMVIGL